MAAEWEVIRTRMLAKSSGIWNFLPKGSILLGFGIDMASNGFYLEMDIY